MILRLMPLLIWAGVISLKKSWFLGRVLLNAPEYWYPIVLRLHRFMVAVARVSVNHDGRGGSAPDLLVWDQGSRKKQRQVDVGVSVDHAAHPGPPGFFAGSLGSGSRETHFFVRTLLRGPTVSAYCASSLVFWRLYTGPLVLKICSTLGVLTWRYSFSLSNGLDIDCSAKRSLALMYVRSAQVLFLLSLFQKKL